MWPRRSEHQQAVEHFTRLYQSDVMYLSTIFLYSAVFDQFGQSFVHLFQQLGVVLGDRDGIIFVGILSIEGFSGLRWQQQRLWQVRCR